MFQGFFRPEAVELPLVERPLHIPIPDLDDEDHGKSAVQ